MKEEEKLAQIEKRSSKKNPDLTLEKYNSGATTMFLMAFRYFFTARLYPEMAFYGFLCKDLYFRIV